jgi:adsorption protein B
VSFAAAIFDAFDAFVAAALFPLAFWVVLSSLDDLIVDVVAWYGYARLRIRHRMASRSDLLNVSEKPIAVMVPSWREQAVIGRMVQENTARIRYRNYHFFLGAYPNDRATADVVEELARKLPNVHAAICPHDGPTSKADCLNWIYQHILAYEQAHGEKFQVLVTHDAEDVIHPDALRWINYYADDYEMIQLPVLPLQTPATLFTHGVYCDEFSEYQTRDMPARQLMGAFIPSNGVGTGFRRDALERLAASERNRIFEPACLTEDYENGLRLKLLGAKQIFLPVHASGVATREYFPKSFRAAVRQRTRWVTGIALQTWERHGWATGVMDRYWLWRDRKGLIGNPISLATNFTVAYGIASCVVCGICAVPSRMAEAAAGLGLLLACTSAFGVYRLVYRGWCTAKVFGSWFVLLLPLRAFYANLINAVATACAVWNFARSKWTRRPLTWLKTEHQFPSQAALEPEKRPLGELLVICGYISEEQLQTALAAKGDGERLGDRLTGMGCLTEDELYEALSLQEGLPQTRIEPQTVRPDVARAFPVSVVTKWQVLPFRVEFGTICVAASEPPTPEMQHDLRRFTSLELRFHLVTPTNFRELTKTLL